MQLDVVIVTYRSAAHLPACLASLPDDASVVVVENASGDHAAEVAESTGAKVVRNVTNRGFAAAANQGAALGSAEAVLFLNPDAVVDGTTLEKLTASLEADPTLAAVGPRLVTPDGVEQRAWWPFPSPSGTWAEAFGAHRFWQRSRSDSQGFIVGACMLVRRSAFQTAGGFDERFWLYGEETDLCRRFWDAGWKVKLAPGATATHIGGASGETVAPVTFEHFQRGAEHYIAKHHGRWGLLSHRLGLLAGSVLRLPLLVLLRDERARYRRAIVVRLLSQLRRAPLKVA